MAGKGVLRVMEGNRVGFWCPGCNEIHVVSVPPAPQAWGFNGDFDKPTFTPSVLVTGIQRLTEEQYQAIMRKEKVETKPLVCHSFVTNGMINFLGDCTHSLANQTVALTVPFAEDDKL